MRDNRSPHSVPFLGPALIPDKEGFTPLDSAVLNGNATILTMLLEGQHRRIPGARVEKEYSSQEKVLPGNLLVNALGLESLTVVRLLSRSVIDVQHTDHNGNTALHLAVRSGKIQYVTEILQSCNKKPSLDVDAQEVVYGWTPLILASARGDLAIVELLLRAGADPEPQDHFGWRAKDHAAFRGWLPMAKKLEALTADHLKGKHERNLRQQRRPSRRPNLSTHLSRNNAQKNSHGQSQIFVNLGALDTYKPVTAVDLSPYVWPDPYDPQREADFYVDVRAINGSQATEVIQLPILEDMANKPLRFATDNAKDFKLAFNICHSRTSGNKKDQHIGCAVALLNNLKQGLGPSRESLIRNFKVPILHKTTLAFIGTVTFYFLIMTPFPHPDPKQAIHLSISFPSRNGIPIIGHRGILGSSFASI